MSTSEDHLADHQACAAIADAAAQRLAAVRLHEWVGPAADSYRERLAVTAAALAEVADEHRRAAAAFQVLNEAGG